MALQQPLPPWPFSGPPAAPWWPTSSSSPRPGWSALLTSTPRLKLPGLRHTCLLLHLCSSRQDHHSESVWLLLHYCYANSTERIGCLPGYCQTTHTMQATAAWRGLPIGACCPAVAPVLDHLGGDWPCRRPLPDEPAPPACACAGACSSSSEYITSLKSSEPTVACSSALSQPAAANHDTGVDDGTAPAAG
jgi:hypothetical protein